MLFFKILSYPSSQDSPDIPQILMPFLTHEVYSDHSLDQIIKILFENFETAKQHLDQFEQNPFYWAIPRIGTEHPQILKNSISFLSEHTDKLQMFNPRQTPASFLLSCIQHYLNQYNSDNSGNSATGSLNDLLLELSNYKDFLTSEGDTDGFNKVFTCLKDISQDTLERNMDSAQTRRKLDQERANIQLNQKNTDNHQVFIQSIQTLISEIKTKKNITIDFEKTQKCYLTHHRDENTALEKFLNDLQFYSSKEPKSYAYKTGSFLVIKSHALNLRLCILPQDEHTYVMLPILEHLKESQHSAAFYAQYAYKFQEITSSLSAPKEASPAQPTAPKKSPPISQQKMWERSITPPKSEIGSNPSSNYTASTQATICYSETVKQDIWLPCAKRCTEVFKQADSAIDMTYSTIQKTTTITLKVRAYSLDASPKNAIEAMFDTLLKNSQFKLMENFFDNAKRSILRDVEQQSKQSPPPTSAAENLAGWAPTSQTKTERPLMNPRKIEDKESPPKPSDPAIANGPSYTVVLVVVLIVLIAIAFPYLISHLNLEKSNTTIDTNARYLNIMELQNRSEYLNIVPDLKQRKPCSSFIKEPLGTNDRLQELNFYKKLEKKTIKLDSKDRENKARLEVDLLEFSTLFAPDQLDRDSVIQIIEEYTKSIPSVKSVFDSALSFLEEPRITIHARVSFQGQTQNGAPHGYGILEQGDIDQKPDFVAIGYFKSGQFVMGKITYGEDLHREGFFNGVDDHHLGTRTYRSGIFTEMAQGEFVNGELVKGLIRFDNHRGSTAQLEGHFKDEQLEGYGVRVKNGRQEGLFKKSALLYGNWLNRPNERNILLGQFKYGHTLVRGLVEDDLGNITWQQS